MGTDTHTTTQQDKQITVDVPADRLPEFYAFFARFLAAPEWGERRRGRGGRGPRGRGGRGPDHRHCHHGHGHDEHGRDARHGFGPEDHDARHGHRADDDAVTPGTEPAASA